MNVYCFMYSVKHSSLSYRHGECPSKETMDTFLRICDSFIQKNPTELIGKCFRVYRFQSLRMVYDAAWRNGGVAVASHFQGQGFDSRIQSVFEELHVLPCALLVSPRVLCFPPTLQRHVDWASWRFQSLE